MELDFSSPESKSVRLLKTWLHVIRNGDVADFSAFYFPNFSLLLSPFVSFRHGQV
jgi:hypothetical protein